MINTNHCFDRILFGVMLCNIGDISRDVVLLMYVSEVNYEQ